MRPIEFIQTIRESDGHIERIYMNGGCYQFYKILKKLYPEAEPLINIRKDHVVTKIDGDLYDIKGFAATGIYLPLVDKKEIEICEEWGFSKNHYYTSICVNCEEEI